MFFTFFLINQFEAPALTLWVLAWIFLIIGIISLTILIIHTKYGREISIKLSTITIVTAALLIGFAIHFILINFGI